MPYRFYEPTVAACRLGRIDLVEVILEKLLARPELREDRRFGAAQLLV